MRVAVAGASGKMGGRLVHLVHQSGDLEITGGLERAGHPAIGKDLGEVVGLGTLGVSLVDDLHALIPKIDLLFEFTIPEASLEHVRVMATHAKAIYRCRLFVHVPWFPELDHPLSWTLTNEETNIPFLTW